MDYLFYFLLVVPASTQFISPCPRLFKYEPELAEKGRWYGVFTVLSDVNITGVWLRLIFDKESIQIGNWFGEALTKDNKEYLLKNPHHKLVANESYNLRFYINYNPKETPAQLTMVKLNGKIVCPEGEVSTEPSVTTTTLLSNRFPNKSNDSDKSTEGTFVPTHGASNQSEQSSNKDESDFFQGDFAIFNNPRPLTSVNDATCGTVVTLPRPLITYSQPTQEAEFPWHAAIYRAQGVDLRFICGASLITRYHLITVAHCVTKRVSRETVNPDDLLVYLGKYYSKIWTNPGIQNRQVEKITIHSQFNPQFFMNNIAVVKLASPAEITFYVRPVCLWDEDTRLLAVTSRVGNVVGWGWDENGLFPEKLTKARMPVVSHETCIYSYPDFYSRYTSSTSYCAGFNNGTSVCNGDSGAGMVFPKTYSNSESRVWQLRGIVSVSVALKNQTRCDPSNYVIFTDVAKYLDWIHASLN
ncbi:clotting factor C-like [Zophobas morio]|uniref:clotting factor C-like n=1 Tax=Zophobas morio TaxID=2755281 RepID=UPI0030834B0A